MYDLDLYYKFNKLKEKFLLFIVFNLIPRKIAYWCTIRTWAFATCGKYNKNDCTSITTSQVLDCIHDWN